MAKKTYGTGKSKKNSAASAEELGMDDFEEEGFVEGDFHIKDAVATFSFNMSTEVKEREAAVNQQSPLIKPQGEVNATPEAFTGTAKGLTPPIDGEYFSLKRGYQLRPSTIRKLNEFKSRHPNVNVYLNTILDAAILHYYNYIFNENGEF